MLLKVIVLSLFASTSVFASVAEPESAWSKKSVRVCWGSSPDAVRADLPRLTKMLVEHSEFDSFSTLYKLQVSESITRE